MHGGARINEATEDLAFHKVIGRPPDSPPE